MVFLQDGGANTAPQEYLVAVERVFRAVATKDPTSMGPKSLTSRKLWGSRDILWRKREVSQIAVFVPSSNL